MDRSWPSLIPQPCSRRWPVSWRKPRRSADIVSRLAVVLRDAIPFERLHVLRLDRAESFVLYVVRASGELEVTGHRIADAAASAGADRGRRAVAHALHRAPGHPRARRGLADVDADERLHRGTPGADGQRRRPAGAGLHQDSLRSAETLRRERIDSLERLLHTMAGALDIRHVFAEVSDVVRGGLPHDILAITSWGEDGASFRVYAMAGAEVDDPAFWAPTILTGDDRALLHRDAYVIHDVDAEIAPDSVRGRIFGRLGVRSALRVPMPLGSRRLRLAVLPVAADRIASAKTTSTSRAGSPITSRWRCRTSGWPKRRAATPSRARRRRGSRRRWPR